MVSAVLRLAVEELITPHKMKLQLLQLQSTTALVVVDWEVRRVLRDHPWF